MDSMFRDMDSEFLHEYVSALLIVRDTTRGHAGHSDTDALWAAARKEVLRRELQDSFYGVDASAFGETR